MEKYFKLEYSKKLTLPPAALEAPYNRIIIDDRDEGYCLENFEVIHKFINDNNIKVPITLFSGNFAVERLYQEWLDATKNKRLIAVRSENKHYSSLASYYKSINPNHRNNGGYTNYIKKHFYCCLNNRQHDHRCETLVYLNHLNLIDKGLVSFRQLKKDTHTDFTQRAAKSPLSKEFRQETEKLLPLHLDFEFHEDPIHYSKPFNFNKKIYSSLINLTTETLYYDPGMFLTEKTWKPFFAKQVLIMIGQKNSLKWIRDKGFKTFNYIIDESYDQLEDDKRLYAAIDQLHMLHEKYTLDELNAITGKTRRYNYNHALRLQNV